MNTCDIATILRQNCDRIATDLRLHIKKYVGLYKRGIMMMQ